MESRSRYDALQSASRLTLLINSMMAFLKLGIGFVSGSMAVVSDGIHTFSDVITTAMVMVGLRLSNQKADTEHPYGHQRIESIISLFLAFLLGLTALGLGYQGIQKLSAPGVYDPSWLALGITAASIAAKEWMYHFTKRVAITYSSTSLLSDAWHHRTDAISSIAVLIGVGGAFFGIGVLEPLATVGVCAVILKAAWDIGKAAISQLMDCSVDDSVYGTIRDQVLSVEGVEQIDLLRTRISNTVIFAEIEIAVDASLTVGQGHEIAEKVHDLVEGANKDIGHCMVHVNPM